MSDKLLLLLITLAIIAIPSYMIISSIIEYIKLYNYVTYGVGTKAVIISSSERMYRKGRRYRYVYKYMSEEGPQTGEATITQSRAFGDEPIHPNGSYINIYYLLHSQEKSIYLKSIPLRIAGISIVMLLGIYAAYMAVIETIQMIEIL